MGLWDCSDWTPTGVSLLAEPKASRRGSEASAQSFNIMRDYFFVDLED